MHLCGFETSVPCGAWFWVMTYFPPVTREWAVCWNLFATETSSGGGGGISKGHNWKLENFHKLFAFLRNLKTKKLRTNSLRFSLFVNIWVPNRTGSVWVQFNHLCQRFCTGCTNSTQQSNHLKIWRIPSYWLENFFRLKIPWSVASLWSILPALQFRQASHQEASGKLETVTHWFWVCCNLFPENVWRQEQEMFATMPK